MGGRGHGSHGGSRWTQEEAFSARSALLVHLSRSCV